MESKWEQDIAIFQALALDLGNMEWEDVYMDMGWYGWHMVKASGIRKAWVEEISWNCRVWVLNQPSNFQHAHPLYSFATGLETRHLQSRPIEGMHWRQPATQQNWATVIEASHFPSWQLLLVIWTKYVLSIGISWIIMVYTHYVCVCVSIFHWSNHNTSQKIPCNRPGPM